MKNNLINNIKIAVSFLIMLALITTVSYASTDYRFLSDNEIANYTKFDINENNINNLKNTRIVNADEKIYDFANLFTDTEELKIRNEIDTFTSLYNLDFAVVTLQDPNANDASDVVFADDFYDYNDFGIGDTRDGILMLINIRNDVAGNRYVYFSTTGQAILIFDDERLSSLVDSFVYGSNVANDYVDTVYADGVSSSISEACYFANSGIPNSNLDAYIDENGDYHYEPGYHRKQMTPLEKIASAMPIIITIVIITIIVFYCVNASALKQVKKASSANLYLKKDSLNFTKKEDEFLTTHTTSTRLSSDSSSGGGGGGSSSHSSSSGSSHGGGGGHF